MSREKGGKDRYDRVEGKKENVRLDRPSEGLKIVEGKGRTGN